MKLLLICNPGGHLYNDGTENFGLPTQGVGTYPKFDTQALRGKEVVYG